MNSLQDITSKSSEEAARDARRIRQWVRAAMNGDKEAFGEIVKTYYPRIYALALGMVNNAADARDLAQITWIKAWRSLKGYRESSAFFTWLYRIAVNTCLDFLRRRARRPEQALEEADALMAAAGRRVRGPDEEVSHKELDAAFRRALNELSDTHRMTLILREVQGLSYRQIAAAMRCRPGTVMSRLFYARRFMQKRLKNLL